MRTILSSLLGAVLLSTASISAAGESDHEIR